MPALLSPAVEVARLLNARALNLRAAILDLAEAVAKDRPTAAIEAQLADLLRDTKAAADVAARLRVLMLAEAADDEGRMRAAAKITGIDIPTLPNVQFAEAIDSLVSRRPALLQDVIRAGETPAQAIRRVYESNGILLSRTTSLEVTQRVRDLLASALSTGVSRTEVVESIRSLLDDWSSAYANIVYRNNVQTAYTDGVFRQVIQPGVSAMIGALVFDAVGGSSGDGTTTLICRRFHGTLLAPDDPRWDGRSTPCHHGCRSGLQLVTWPELERMGAVRRGVVLARYPWPKQRAAEGFGRRRTGVYA